MQEKKNKKHLVSFDFGGLHINLVQYLLLTKLLPYFGYANSNIPFSFLVMFIQVQREIVTTTQEGACKDIDRTQNESRFLRRK